MEKDYKIHIVENNFSIIIENKEYYIYESYILNGSGYTFRIYNNSKCRKGRENCYGIDANNNKIVIVGKKYNYLLIKKKDSFEYDINTYTKDILRLEILYYKGTINPYTFKCIFFNDEKLATYASDINNPDKLFLNEIELRKKIIRKKKIDNLNYESDRI